MQCVFFPTIANLGQIWKAISLSDQIGRLADFEKKEEVNQMDRTNEEEAGNPTTKRKKKVFSGTKKEDVSKTWLKQI